MEDGPRCHIRYKPLPWSMSKTVNIMEFQAHDQHTSKLCLSASVGGPWVSLTLPGETLKEEEGASWGQRFLLLASEKQTATLWPVHCREQGTRGSSLELRMPPGSSPGEQDPQSSANNLWASKRTPGLWGDYSLVDTLIQRRGSCPDSWPTELLSLVVAYVNRKCKTNTRPKPEKGLLRNNTYLMCLKFTLKAILKSAKKIWRTIFLVKVLSFNGWPPWRAILWCMNPNY